MALVRCPKHKIPYNDENPRGCPACAREKDGGDQAVMQELARVSRSMRSRPDEATAPPPRTSTGSITSAARRSVTEAPLAPAVPQGAVARLLQGMRDNQRLTLAALAVVIMILVLMATTGPRFVEAPNPPELTETLRPLPIHPNSRITTVFAVLGTQSPQSVPDAPRLARYSYGTDFQIDALNQTVYAIAFSVPNRSWQGLRVGMPERTVRGTLALLGATQEESPAVLPPPQTMGKYRVYQSLEQRPTKRLKVEIRPPNGCYDVLVSLQPRAAGLLLQGNRRYAVIGEGDVTLDWVSTGIRIVNRALSGPDSPRPAC
jgi:hypothetical protein